MLSCKEVTRLVSESLDRKLPLSQRIAMRMHLLMCKLCSRYKKQLLLIREAIRHYSLQTEDVPPLTPDSLSPQASERIRRSLRQESE